jgi:hypothetical protein
MRSELLDTLSEFRPILLKRVQSLFDGKRDPFDTSGCCRSGSAALLHTLRQAFPACSWSFTGGYGADNGPLNERAGEYLNLDHYPGGLIDQAGKWNGHFWVEGKLPDGSMVIVDATADQFGHEPIVITDADDPRYRKNILAQHDEKVWVVEPETTFAFGVFNEWQTLHIEPLWTPNW